jgi:hypothetical protein
MGHHSVAGHHGGQSLPSSFGGHGGPASSSPSAFHHGGSVALAGNDSDWAASSLEDLSCPIPLPVNRFTLPPIESGDNYLKTWDLILFWFRSPGFSTARTDSQLVTDDRNTHASQFCEGQLRTSLKDGTVCYLFENTGSTYFGKGFEMLQVLEDNFCPLSISNLFTTLRALLNNTQGNKEGIHEFWSRFEDHLGALSWSSVNIRPIFQVMLFCKPCTPNTTIYYHNLLQSTRTSPVPP